MYKYSNIYRCTNAEPSVHGTIKTIIWAASGINVAVPFSVHQLCSIRPVFTNLFQLLDVIQFFRHCVNMLAPRRYCSTLSEMRNCAYSLLQATYQEAAPSNLDR